MASATLLSSANALVRNPITTQRLLPSRSPLFHCHFRNPSPSPKPLKLVTPKASATPTLPTPRPPLVTTISDSTRTVTSLFCQGLFLARVLAASAQSLVQNIAAAVSAAPTAEELAEIQSMKGNLACAVGPLFFAALRDRPSGYLNTPLTVVAAGMSRWLDIYSGVLMVRVLLSWFPNIPWDRQPLSAIRDLCDPYLNLFRNIIPPIFDTLDVSPLLAFAVLGTLGSILNNSRGMY